MANPNDKENTHPYPKFNPDAIRDRDNPQGPGPAEKYERDIAKADRDLDTTRGGR